MMQDFGNRLLFQLALTTECIGSSSLLIISIYPFNSHSLRSVSGKSSAFPIVLILSTRTHYGVYHSLMPSIIATKTFQLALTTECIETGLMQATEISSFNSHSLRSVSRIVDAGFAQHCLSTRTHYGVYLSFPKSFLSWIAFQLALTTECISKIA